MNDPRLPLRAAKLVVAAAWADGKVTAPERAYLRKRFSNAPHISGADWAALSRMLDKPMSEVDQQRALTDVLDSIQSEDDKAFVLDTVVELASSDGEVTAKEVVLIEQVKRALESKTTGVLNRVSRLVGGLIRRSTGSAGES